MKLLRSHALNRKVIRFLKSRCAPGVPALAAPDSHPDPYGKLGSRPDEVLLVWDDLGSALPVDCRAIVYGTPALVHPTAGVVLALALGTTCALRVPPDCVEAALAAGCTVTQTWSNGGMMNIEEELGRGWVFGGGGQGSAWLLAVYQSLVPPA
jgi:hypothetical protein